MFAIILSLLLTTSKTTETPNGFWDYWGDGKGEVSSYRVVVPRYGEPREGFSVLIFVTEDISRTTRIKVESNAIPPNDRVPVLKLNRIVKFTTGLYDYSLMTSTFSSVNAEMGRTPFEPLKISFSAQEWCGHVMQILTPQRDQVELTLHSYFQSEGDQKRNIKLPANAAYEDNLPIWIRELNGDVLTTGQKRDLQIFPSSWNSRAAHQQADFQAGWITKEDGETLKSLDGNAATHRWTWQVGTRKETYWVEKNYPRRILKWSSSDGNQGELKKSLRLPYWSLHNNADLPYREQLGISK